MPQESNHDEEGKKAVKKAGAVPKNSSPGKVWKERMKFQKTHIQLNISTKATLGQKKVAVVKRWPL